MFDAQTLVSQLSLPSADTVVSDIRDEVFPVFATFSAVILGVVVIAFIIRGLTNV